MNQGKLEIVKQEMARVNVNILGISELKWTGMGEFNSDDHYVYYCGQESIRRTDMETEAQGIKELLCSIDSVSFSSDVTQPQQKTLQSAQGPHYEHSHALEKEMATHSSILAWKIPWVEEPGRLWSMGLQRVGHE